MIQSEENSKYKIQSNQIKITLKNIVDTIRQKQIDKNIKAPSM